MHVQQKVLAFKFKLYMHQLPPPRIHFAQRLGIRKSGLQSNDGKTK